MTASLQVPLPRLSSQARRTGVLLAAAGLVLAGTSAAGASTTASASSPVSSPGVASPAADPAGPTVGSYEYWIPPGGETISSVYAVATHGRYLFGYQRIAHHGWQLVRWDHGMDVLTGVSVTPHGKWANDSAVLADVSPDGRYVTFTSAATNLVASDTSKQREDIFRRDMRTRTTIMVNLDSHGVQHSGYWTSGGAMSDSGHLIAFASDAAKLTPRHVRFIAVYVRNVRSGRTKLVSMSSHGTAVDWHCWNVDLSNSGRYVMFGSRAGTLGPGDDQWGRADVFVKDRRTGAVAMVTGAAGLSGTTDRWPESLSGDGNIVAFQVGDWEADYEDYVPLVSDLATGVTAPLLLDPTGAPVHGSGVEIVDAAGNWVLAGSQVDVTGEEGDGAAADDDWYLIGWRSATRVRLTGPELPSGVETTPSAPWPYVVVDRDLAGVYVSTTDSFSPGDTDASEDTYRRVLTW